VEGVVTVSPLSPVDVKKFQLHEMRPQLRSVEREVDDGRSSSTRDYRQDLTEVAGSDDDFAARRHMLELRVHHAHDVAQRAVDDFEAVTIHHGGLVPHDE
jgi:hypothetical protein